MYLISTSSRGIYSFATNAIAAKTYAKFQQKYSAHLEAFAKKTGEQQKTSEAVKRSTQKAYSSPFNDQHHKPYYSPIHTIQTMLDMIGAEQVSAHYENFGKARKELLTFFAFYFSMRAIAATPDVHFYADAMAPASMFIFMMLYWWLEAKNFVFLPILLHFYRKITRHEIHNLEAFYAENVEVRVRSLMANAKSQIDFKTLHNDYLSVRNNTILNFLINEQVQLKNHLFERAQNILKQAESIESMNQSRIIGQVMNETFASVDKAYADNKAQIEQEMFKLALEGIATGKMDYSKDPILPHILKTIEKTVEKFNSISPEEQKKLVTLTPEQIEAIRLSDARTRDEFLQNEPKIDGSLKNYDHINQILKKWGGRDAK